MFESQEQFEVWCLQNHVPPDVRTIIGKIRSSDPVRAVRSGKQNMSGRYPSRKMGVTIQFESHKNELPYIRVLDDDNDVIEFYDQPNKLKLSYEGADGRQTSAFHTPDLFVIRRNSAGWEENKTEKALIELETHNPNRYCRDETGEWCSPAGETYVAQIGFFYYKVVSSKTINWTLQRNIEFLEDYFRVDSPIVSLPARENILGAVSSEFGISLEDLFTRTSTRASRDDIFMMIAHEEIFVDLYLLPIPEFKHVRVFLNKEASLAYCSILQDSTFEQLYDSPYVTLKHHEHLLWDRKSWQVVNVGERFISLLSDENELTALPIAGINTLIKEGLITSNSRSASPSRMAALDHPDVRKAITTASSENLAEANYRVKLVLSYLSGDALPQNTKISERTLRYWAAGYRKAEESYGCGYIGLIPKPLSGNTTPRLPSDSKELMDEFIENSYEDLKQRRRRAVHDQYVLACAERQIEPASYVAFCEAVKLRPQHTQRMKRTGSRAAYADGEFYWDLELTTPRHGDRPFHIVHIDHTLADVECRCSHTGKNMGRPWFSQMTDAYSRRILAKYITYDPPSYRTVMMLFRECIRRFQRAPQIVIVDGAFEFSCTYFETLLAILEITKKVRPPAKARFGSSIERLFGTANSQFFHNLEGNTQIMKYVRQVTPSVNPKSHALWTLESVDAMLTAWAYEVYDTIEHTTLGQSPRAAFNQGIELFGNRDFKAIPYDETFLMLTMPSTPRGRAKVGKRGIKVNNIQYWSDSFNDEKVRGTRPPTRLDPWNAGVMYAYVRRRWVEAYSQYFAVFRNRSEREMILASGELRHRNKLTARRSQITAKKLAEFLQSAEAEEALLHQRLADLAARQIVVKNGLLSSSYIYGSAKNSPPETQGSVVPNENSGDRESSSSSDLAVSQIYKTV